jgi:hypothetical protein
MSHHPTRPNQRMLPSLFRSTAGLWLGLVLACHGESGQSRHTGSVADSGTADSGATDAAVATPRRICDGSSNMRLIYQQKISLSQVEYGAQGFMSSVVLGSS